MEFQNKVLLHPEGTQRGYARLNGIVVICDLVSWMHTLPRHRFLGKKEFYLIEHCT
jgi:hypothetical protein